MRARSNGRVLIAGVSVLALLATGGLGGSVPPSASAASSRVESAWSASLGADGVNGSATVRVYDTARGSVGLSLRRLTPSSAYPVAIRRGACASLGTQLLGLGTPRATTSGALSATLPLTVAQAATVRAAAGGTNRVSIVAGSGSRARCGTLMKSLAVTPQIWFGPLPSTVPGWPAGGAMDFRALFDANAPWPRVAGRTQVFQFYEFMVGAQTSTAELRRMIDALKARQIRMAIEWYALTRPGDCGVDVNGFGDGAGGLLPILRRIRSLGGAVNYVSVVEPFSGGVLWDGPNACHWSVATVAKKVAAQVKLVRAEFPGIEVGLVEGYNGPAWIGHAEEWIDACEAAAGERLAYFHLDTDFEVQGWSDGAAQIQAYARSRGTRFGILYTQWPPPETDAEWFAGTGANVRAFELDGAGPPDDAVFEVFEIPDHLLPETGATTLTRAMADYTRIRTAATIAATSPTTGGTLAVSGSIRTLGGDPVAGTSVGVSATPLDGRYQVVEFRGSVPAGVSHALVQTRVNQWVDPTDRGPADLTFYEFGYAEGGGTENLVPRPHFEEGRWGPGWGDGSLTAVPSDRGTGQMLRVVVTPTQTLGFNSQPFAVTPGAQYRMWVAVRVPEASVGHLYLAVVFLKDEAGLQVSGQDTFPLTPAPIPIGSTVTDAAGAYSLTTSPLEPGRYRVLAESAGDATYWPARARTEVTVP
jgi:hypothetical protein